MPLLINRELVEADNWTTVNEETIEQAIASNDDIIVPLALFEEHKAALESRSGAVAPLLTGDDAYDEILADPNRFALIAISIPALRDGRCFSIARLLKRAGFKGQLRATGDVSHDRLDFLTRCGFNALEVPEDRYSDEALNAFDEFSVRYQGADDDNRPVYHR